MGANALGGGQPKIIGMKRSQRRELGLMAKIEGRSPVRAALGQIPKLLVRDLLRSWGPFKVGDATIRAEGNGTHASKR